MTLVELPLDIERRVLELAVLAFPTDISTFSVVCQYFQAWVESLIYRKIVLDYPESKATLLLRTVCSRPNVLEQNVKHLYVTHIVDYEDAHRIISVCKNAETIVAWSPLLPLASGMSTILSQSGLTRLSIQLSTFHGSSIPDLTNPVFARLTHLEIVHPPGYGGGVDWDQLHSLTNLQHLTMGKLQAERHAHLIPIFDSLLQTHDSLRALVIICSDEKLVGDLPEDKRVLIIPSFHYPLSPSEFWDSVRQGDSDFWSLTEKMVQQRKK
ncbi:hypothetical protein DL96DRAFT_301989 [Flagelloscypha sp. PMI_526]|nr:hypothetical protein DL96DRAFT_301989 [Flagelloscypha sp. PMI_526]